jgi:segregation and condensation protein A
VAGDADYRVGLDIYNGPLDLLLYLIRERELDIHDIPISEIAEQFLAHLEVVKRIDVDRAGDFLLMAATLMLIKSRMLLPDPVEDDEHDEELDPRTDLVRQLLEYKQFKDAAYGLADAERLRDLRFEGGLEGPAATGPDAGKLLADIGVGDLLLAFERMMRETLAEVDHQVFREELPLRAVEERIAAQLAAAEGPVSFRDLFGERRDRLYIVSVFLCLLEMLKRRRIEIERGRDIVDLKIRLRPPEPEAAPPPEEAPVEETAPGAVPEGALAGLRSGEAAATEPAGEPGRTGAEDAPPDGGVAVPAEDTLPGGVEARAAGEASEPVRGEPV